MAISGITGVFLNYDTIPWDTSLADTFVLPSGRRDAGKHLDRGASVYTIVDGWQVRIDCAYWREILDAADRGEISYLTLDEVIKQTQPKKPA